MVSHTFCVDLCLCAEAGGDRSGSLPQAQASLAVMCMRLCVRESLERGTREQETSRDNSLSSF